MCLKFRLCGSIAPERPEHAALLDCGARAARSATRLGGSLIKSGHLLIHARSPSLRVGIGGGRCQLTRDTACSRSFCRVLSGVTVGGMSSDG